MRRQRIVSAAAIVSRVPDDNTAVLRRLVGGDPDAPRRGRSSRRPQRPTRRPLLVAAACSTGDRDLLARAGEPPRTTRDRQLVALAAAHLRGDADLLDALVRDHLADHPDHLLAAWIAAPLPHTLTAPTSHDPTNRSTMSDLDTAPAPAVTHATTSTRRTIARWMVSFAGFPLGGFAAFLLIGPVDSLGRALVGGLLTGADPRRRPGLGHWARPRARSAGLDRSPPRSA